MTDSSSGPKKRGRKGRSFTTRSGKTLKLNRNFSDKFKANKHERSVQKALYLSTLPKNRWKRLLYRLHPRRVAAYWFSREGAIMALKVTGIGIVVCFLLTIGVFAYFRKDLPKIKGIAGDKLGGSITYYDRTGKVALWQDYDAAKRIPVEGDQISQYMKDATVAIEDKDFYKHGAFDMRGIMRAAFNDVTGAGPIQGGSTITQQLVKLNQQWTDNRTITRKVKELILAVELEREYSKSDILTGYLNAAPYGGIENGVEVAAQDYFHTDAKNLTLAQSAFLAAIPKNPPRYSPYSDSRWNNAISGDGYFSEEAALGRQHYILDQMADQGMITKQEAADAKSVDILAQVHQLSSKYNNIKAPYFVLAAKQQVEQKYASTTVQRGGWKVTTTLNLDLQADAEKQVADDMPTIRRYKGDTAAFVAEDVKTGQIVALVGGADFSNPDYGKINFAQTPIPPGSSFKPYDYVTFINDKNVGAGSVLYDSQGPLEGWPCTNRNRPQQGGNCLWDYDFKYPGAMTLRYALAGSRNVPAVKAMLSVGTDKVIKTAETMMNGGTSSADGFGYNCYSDVKLTKETQCYGSSAIGDGAYLHLDEHVNGLATMARLGNYIPSTYILKITNAAGKTIDEWKQPKGKQVIKPESAYIINDILSDPNASYLRSDRKFQRQKNGWHFAVKTGTTNDNFDGLMASWSTKYAAVVWVGHHTRNVEMTGGHMEAMTEPIMRAWMEDAHQNLPVDNWKMPSTVKVAPAYVMTSGFGTGAILPSPRTDLYPAAYVAKNSGASSATIDKVSGKLATDCTPPAARQTLGNANANSFSVDKFVDGGLSSGANTTQQDDVHNCGDALPSISFTTPGAPCTGADNGGQGCAITIWVSAGTHPLTSADFPGALQVSINGQAIGNYSITGAPVTLYYKPTATGTATVNATATDSVLYQTERSTSLQTVAPVAGGDSGNSGGNGPGNSSP